MCLGAESLLIFSTITSAVGAISQSRAESNAAQYQAQVADNNAKLAEFQAQDAAERAEEDRSELRRDVARLKAAGRTSFAAGNVLLGSGSPVDWELDIAEQEHINLERIDRAKQLEQFGFRTQQSNYLSEANNLRAQAKNARTSGFLSATSTIVGSAFNFRTNFGRDLTRGRRLQT